MICVYFLFTVYLSFKKKFLLILINSICKAGCFLNVVKQWISVLFSLGFINHYEFNGDDFKLFVDSMKVIYSHLAQWNFVLGILVFRDFALICGRNWGLTEEVNKIVRIQLSKFLVYLIAKKKLTVPLDPVEPNLAQS